MALIPPEGVITNLFRTVGGKEVSIMKGRESEMPDCDQWAHFFDAPRVVDLLGCGESNGDVVEFGCGYGTFTIPAARKISGILHAIDIDPKMISQVAGFRLTNVRPIQRDFLINGTGLSGNSVVHAMIFNILHVENPVGILREAIRVLVPGGKASIIHWRSDINTPRGPSPAIRPSSRQCLSWAKEAGFLNGRDIALGQSAPWHFGLQLKKSD